MREDRSISWDQLQQSILSKLYYLMINGAQAQVLRSSCPNDAVTTDLHRDSVFLTHTDSLAQQILETVPFG